MNFSHEKASPHVLTQIGRAEGLCRRSFSLLLVVPVAGVVDDGNDHHLVAYLVDAVHDDVRPFEQFACA
jgi:hypothetical protein